MVKSTGIRRTGKTLNRAIDDLSSYLEGLQSPPVPSPLQLVEPINRLREVLDAQPISALDLFTPDLSIRPPDARYQEKIDAELFLKVADNLRACLERALLNALKNPDDRTALKEFSRIFTHLASIDRRGSLRQLWWIGAASVKPCSTARSVLMKRFGPSSRESTSS
jgi:chemosensory pili system protein ChpA (sensor histidine kinase/response regulator)